MVSATTQRPSQSRLNAGPHSTALVAQQRDLEYSDSPTTSPKNIRLLELSLVELLKREVLTHRNLNVRIAAIARRPESRVPVWMIAFSDAAKEQCSWARLSFPALTISKSPRHQMRPLVDNQQFSGLCFVSELRVIVYESREVVTIQAR